MADEYGLKLLSISLASAERAVAQRLWSVILGLAVDLHGAREFSIDPTTEHRKAPGVGALLSAIGLTARVDPKVRTPLDSSTAQTLVDLGPRVLAMNLYGEAGWVAGISDWGQDISALFGEEGTTAALQKVDEFGLREQLDLAEVESRPS